MKRSLGAAILVILVSGAIPAFANSRSAVSLNGLDTNPCTVSSPCRSFNAAIAQTTLDGEVIALDSAGYGPFTITYGMTVSGAPGIHAAITVPSGGTGIQIIATSTDNITIRNLTLISASATEGIVVTSSAEVRVLDCLIRGFENDGIVAGGKRTIIDHCVIIDDFYGIFLNGNSAQLQAVVSNCLIEDHVYGLDVGGDVAATIREVTVAGTQVGGQAVFVNTNTGQHAIVVLDSSTLSFAPTAIAAATSGTSTSITVYLANDEIAFAPLAISTSGTATVKSYGNNRFSEVTTVGPLSPIALQ